MHTKDFIPALTSIRGVAALIVVFHHIYITYSSNDFLSYFKYGGLGVDLFFVLSGFIMAFVYADTDFRKENFSTFYKKFITSRFARIYPLHLATLLSLLFITYILSGFKQRYSESDFSTISFLANLILVQNWGFTNVGWNMVSWSISAEWFMYLLFPFMLYFKDFQIFQKNAFNFLILLAVTYTFSVLFLNMNLLSGISIAGMIRVFFEFTLGFLLCLNKSHFSSIFSKTREFASIFFVGMMAVSISYYDSAKYLFLPATAMLVVHLGIKSCYVSNILSANVFLYFGKISFSIYMWHWIVINIHNWLRDNSIISVKNDLDIYAATASIIAITIFISHFSYLYIELPARQWINKMKQ